MATALTERLREEGSSAFHPEMVRMIREIKEKKRTSRIIIKKSDIKWVESAQPTRSARLIDPRLGFSNSICNVGLGEIAPGSNSGKHKHTEAYIYILSGKGYSIIDGKRHDWEEGDGMYVPPDVYHQHFNVDREKPVRYLRVIPGPLIVNLLHILASINISFEGALEQAEANPLFKGELVKNYFKAV